MTILEESIYNAAVLFLPEAKEKVKNIKTPCRYINIPFFDGLHVSILVFDTEIQKFIRIEYTTNIDRTVGEIDIANIIN